MFGDNIARAIIESHDSRHLVEYDQIKQVLGGMGGPGMQDFIYPGANSLPNGASAFPPAHQMTAFPGGPSPGNFPAGWKPPSF